MKRLCPLTPTGANDGLRTTFTGTTAFATGASVAETDGAETGTGAGVPSFIDAAACVGAGVVAGAVVPVPGDSAPGAHEANPPSRMAPTTTATEAMIDFLMPAPLPVLSLTAQRGSGQNPAMVMHGPPCAPQQFVGVHGRQQVVVDIQIARPEVRLASLHDGDDRDQPPTR